jgi:Domain of unknown function (DUF4282)
MQPQTMSAKGFFASLFDFSFSSLITTKIIKLVYIIAVIAIGLFLLIGLLTGLIQLVSGSAIGGLVEIILTPIIALIYLILSRIYLELVIILFRIGEDVRRLADSQGAPPATGASAYTQGPGYPTMAAPAQAYTPPPGGYTQPPAGGYTPPPATGGFPPPPPGGYVPPPAAPGA